MEVLAPEYVAFSRKLPPGSKSIWEIVEGDFDHFGPAEIKDENRVQKLEEFLGRFFSRQVVSNVLNHFKALQTSALGAEYTLGKPFPVLGQSVIDGIRELPRRTKGAQNQNFGTNRGQQEQQQQQNSFGTTEQEQGNLASGSGALGSGGLGPGDGDEEFKWPAVIEKNRQKHILLTRWTTPLRGVPQRGLTIRERSEEFLSIVGPHPGLLYDPRYPSTGKVSLYHGTREMQLPSFAYDGINPQPRTTEFWGGPTFYTCNSVQYAFEFPLHYHLGQGTNDNIAIQEFKVDVQVLNGEKAPFPGESKFRVKYFSSTNERWQQWVSYHMLKSADRMRLRLRKEDNKEWDVIIGPVCFGGPSADGKVDPVYLNIEGANGRAPLFQAAFCSKRAQNWLQKTFSQVFMECRL